MDKLINKEQQEVIVAFRLKAAPTEWLRRLIKTRRPIGVRSVNQMARQLVVDAADGKLTYVDK
jgi:hypothetical protein